MFGLSSASDTPTEWRKVLCKSGDCPHCGAPVYVTEERAGICTRLLVPVVVTYSCDCKSKMVRGPDEFMYYPGMPSPGVPPLEVNHFTATP
jgi:hypothetical protein